ncbi:phage tail spike protein [Rossellomorea aquimaris]|uniref:phage tail spike protein n=1 Tax=Rossellomorea aquimaris TaxID=189382 RepID=UPI0016535DA4|nr:phage tail spike protein [Rossellomorea aquimaris]
MIHIANGRTDELFNEFIVEEEYWNDERLRELKSNRDTFSFETFADKVYSNFLTDRNRIYIAQKTGDYAEFILDETIQILNRNGSHGRKVYSTASYLELKKSKPIEPQTFVEQAPSVLVGRALNHTAWSPGVIQGTGYRTLNVEEHTSPYDLLKRIASEFRLELNFRVVVRGNKVIARYVDLIQRNGAFRGYEVEFGHDLLGIERKEKTVDIVTALIGVSPADSEGNRKTVFVESEDALNRWGRLNSTGQLQHLYDVYYPESTDPEMSLEELTTYTENELEKRINARIEYSTSIAVLSEKVGQELFFGDTIRVKDEKFNPPLYLEARVHTMSEKGKGKNVEVTLGDYVEFSETEVKSILRSLRDQVNNKINNARLMEYAERRFHEGPTPPEDKSKKWLDTSNPEGINPPVVIWRTFSEESGTWLAGPSGPQGPRGLQGLQGDKGNQGIPGPAGEEGTPSYTHIAYSNSEDGTVGFSIADSMDKEYIGIYVDSNPIDSTTPSRYKWTLIKGAQGDKGIPGSPGSDGLTPYFHTAWANNSTGTNGFSTTSASGKTYIGTYTDFIPADSSDPSQYTWVLIKGEKGETGNQGAQGPQGPQGPNIVDSTTEIEANVIKSNHIDVSNLSAIVADLGTVNAGTLTGVQINGSTFTSHLDEYNFTEIQDNHVHAEGQYVDTTYGFGDSYGEFDINDGRMYFKVGQRSGSTKLPGSKIDFTMFGVVIKDSNVGNGIYLGSDGSIGFGNWYDQLPDGAIYSWGNGIRIDGLKPEVHEYLSKLNGWVDYGAEYTPAAYTKTADGYVHLRGMLKSGTIGSALGRLPVGCRPYKKEIFTGVSSGNVATRIDIGVDGYITPQNGSNSWVSISGISFKAEN